MSKRYYSLSSGNAYRLLALNGHQRSALLSRTEQILGIQFPDEYLRRGQILALVDTENRIFGGAIVICESPFRSLDGIPSGKFDRELVGRLDDLAEVNGVWLSPEMKSPYLSFAFWLQLISYLLETEKRRFLFTFDNSNQKMRDFAAWLRPTILYSGATEMLEGMKAASDETIAIVTRDSLFTLGEMLDSRRSDRMSESKEFSGIVRRLEKRNKRDSADCSTVCTDNV